MRSVYGNFVRNVFINIWKCEIDNMKVKYSKYKRLFVLWVMLLSKNEDFV